MRLVGIVEQITGNMELPPDLAYSPKGEGKVQSGIVYSSQSTYSGLSTIEWRDVLQY